MKSFAPAPRSLLPALLIVLVFAPLFAKEAPVATIDWPQTGTPVLRFTFGKFKSLPGMDNFKGYTIDTTARNLSSSVIPQAKFHVYLFDKNKTRVGEDVIVVNNVGPGESVKFETTVTTSGTPVSVSIEPMSDAEKKITLTVNSLPQGAMLKVDGIDAGTTPRMISVGPGHHILSFSKDGFNSGNFPLELGPDDVSGGSVSYELGVASFDTIELRDGSVLNGDLVSVSGMDIQVRVGGAIQHIDRNKVKRILLTQRDAPSPGLPNAAPSQ